MENESKIRYLEMIQNIISRMASNSFMLKGWTVTLIVGLFAFANVKEMDSNFIWIALIPSVFFWFLDGYFLQQERLFRDLYNDAIKLSEENVDFSMNIGKYIKNQPWKKVVWLKTLRMFYLPIILVIILALLFSI